MKANKELKILELIDSIPEPPFLPFLLTIEDEGQTKIPDNLIKYFKTLNIVLNKKEPTEKILQLLNQYGIEPFQVILKLVTTNEKNQV